MKPFTSAPKIIDVPNRIAMATFGQRVKFMREHWGWTQDDLRQRTGLSKGFLSDIENDKRNASGANLLKLADVLDVSIDWLVRGSKPQKVKCPLCGQGTVYL
jgi:transcriptional regulator with XRE-family HTH domain